LIKKRGGGQKQKVTFLRSVKGYTRKDQIRKTKIMQEPNVSNLSNKILKSGSWWKYYKTTDEFQRKF
jgi:hypothetical protein